MDNARRSGSAAWRPRNSFWRRRPDRGTPRAPRGQRHRDATTHPPRPRRAGLSALPGRRTAGSSRHGEGDMAGSFGPARRTDPLSWQRETVSTPVRGARRRTAVPSAARPAPEQPEGGVVRRAVEDGGSLITGGAPAAAKHPSGARKPKTLVQAASSTRPARVLLRLATDPPCSPARQE